MTLDRIDKHYFRGGSHLTDTGGLDLAELIDSHAESINEVVDVDQSSPLVLYVDGGSLGDDNNNGLSTSKPKKTIGAALDVVPILSRRNTFVKIAAGTYDETLDFGKHLGGSVNLIGELVVEHTGQVEDYEGTSGLNPVGFHQVVVSGFTFEATDDEKWLLFYFDDGTTELVKILTVLAADTVEVGAARLSGKSDADYIKTGGGGTTTKVELVSEGVSIESSEMYLTRWRNAPSLPNDDSLYHHSFYSTFGIKFLTTNSYGSALYFAYVQDLTLLSTACSFRCHDYFALYVANGSFAIHTYPAAGYLTGESLATYHALTGNVFSNITFRAGCYFDGSTHVYMSPTAWLNIRSSVHYGPIYSGDWQSFTLLYPREQGLVIKQQGNIALRVDDRGGLMMRGNILINGPVLCKALSDISTTSSLKLEWRESTGGVPLKIENGCRAYFPSTTMTIDNDESSGASVEISSCPEVHIDDLALTDVPTGEAAITVEHSHVHFAGALSAPVQDYGASPSGGILVVDEHSVVSFDSTATGKNTNAGDSDPLVLRRMSSVCLPASGYDLKDNADGNTVYLGALGSGQTIPTSGNCKNDLTSNPTATEELTVIGRK